MDLLPTEVLVSILDDADFTLGDLAILSRVSRRWHDAVIPRLYEQFTFRFYTGNSTPFKNEEKQLESFLKYGTHVKSLVFHTVTWTSIHEITAGYTVQAVTDVDKCFGILNKFPNLKFIDLYELKGTMWTDFWIFLHYLLTSKPALITLNVRRLLAHDSWAATEVDLEHHNLQSPKALPFLRDFRLQIKAHRTKRDQLTSIPNFVKGLEKCIGNACRDVTRFELKLNMYEPKISESNPGDEYREPATNRLILDRVKSLAYVFDTAGPSPFELLVLDASKVERLEISYVIYKKWLASLSRELSDAIPEILQFTNLEKIFILGDIPASDTSKQNFKDNTISVAVHLLRLQYVVWDDLGLAWRISRARDGNVILQEADIPS